MTSHPYFAEAAVNRIWSHFFGRGIVDPVDDFRSTNPPTHPELLDALARDFREHGYDLRHLMKRIVLSRTYQLSSGPNETNRDDVVNYSRSLPRAFDAEVLLDAVVDVTGVPETFSTAVTEGSSVGQAPAGTRAINFRIPTCSTRASSSCTGGRTAERYRNAAPGRTWGRHSTCSRDRHTSIASARRGAD